MRAVALAPAKQTPNTNTPMPRDTGCCARRQHHRHRACSLHAWRRTSTGDSCWQPTPSSQRLGTRSSHRHRNHAQQGVNTAVIGEAVMWAPSQVAASAAPHRRSSGHPHTLLHVGDYPRASSLDPPCVSCKNGLLHLRIDHNHVARRSRTADHRASLAPRRAAATRHKPAPRGAPCTILRPCATRLCRDRERVKRGLTESVGNIHLLTAWAVSIRRTRQGAHTCDRCKGISVQSRAAVASRRATVVHASAPARSHTWNGAKNPS